jgi:hypothetical protein
LNIYAQKSILYNLLGKINILQLKFIDHLTSDLRIIYMACNFTHYQG